MHETQVLDYAKSLLDAHGDKAEAEAAARVRQFEEKKPATQAETVIPGLRLTGLLSRSHSVKMIVTK